MSTIHAGIDAGGTRTTAIVARDGEPIGRAEGPGSAVRPGRELQSATTMSEVLRQALGASGLRRCEVLVVGAAGAGREAEREELRQALRSEGFADRVVITADIEIALAAGFREGPGIVLTAGTGSIAVARDPHGRLHRSGGYGWQMGDEGSGYAIGRSALGAVSRAADGRSPRTELTTALLAATRSDNFDALVRWAARASVAEVAGLAPAVFDAAARSDTVAQGILDYAARELAGLVLHLLPHFGADERSAVGVAFNGGLLRPTSAVLAQVIHRLSDEPRLRISRDPIEPALGAVWLAGRPER